MSRVIIIRYGELHLKGRNKSVFENRLIANIRRRLAQYKCKFSFGRTRYSVSDYEIEIENDIIDCLKKIFGITSISVAQVVPSDLDKITEAVLLNLPARGSFRVNTNRADKLFPMKSPEISRELGGRILNYNADLVVDLHNPDFTVNVDLREYGNTFVYSEKIAGVGGMPVGTAGNGLLLLSGGIDSPVAGIMMAKRGMIISGLHFHSYPYTSENAKQKVLTLAEKMKEYTGKICLYTCSVTKIQEAIHQFCDPNYMITIVRRAMMRIAKKVADFAHQGCIITGESLGQVASQTLESITVTNEVVDIYPVFRPLIAFDKNDIIELAEKYGTFETSILPYEDCCTVFLPEYPVTKPTLERVIFEESKIPNLVELIEDSFNNIEIIKI